MTTSEHKSNRPSHYVTKKIGHGKHVEFETLGVAWLREDGGLYVKLYGTQIVDDCFYALPNKEKSQSPHEQR